MVAYELGSLFLLSVGLFNRGKGLFLCPGITLPVFPIKSGLLASKDIYYLVLQIVLLWVLSLTPLHPYSV